MMLKTVLLVALGGAIGSVARYLFNVATMRLAGPDFPWGTLGVNIIGSLLIGVIAGLLAFTTEWAQDVRAFAVIGILGGFTTFSAFSLDAMLLWEKGALLQMGLYVVSSVVFSIAATCGGLYLVKVL